MSAPEKEAFPPQHVDRMPAEEQDMRPRPVAEDEAWRPSGLLEGKRLLITGADSGIGRAVAILFAKEGADIAIAYYDEHDDARDTKERVEQLGRRCELFPGDLGDPSHAEEIVGQAVESLGGIEVLVNNAAVQFEHLDFAEAPVSDIERTVRSNLLSTLFVTKWCLPHLQKGASIITSTSVNAYRGSSHLAAYSATKGALLAFTRSLASQLAPRGIRANGVAPGPVWTPLIVESFPAEEVASFGTSAPIGRAAQPFEIAPSYLFLAAERWSGYMSGQVLHPNGWEVIGS